MSHPDDVHALVLNRILALPKASPESHHAHADYQATRLAIRPKLLAQKALLERSLMSGVNNDAAVLALDGEIAALWWALDSRIGDKGRTICVQCDRYEDACDCASRRLHPLDVAPPVEGCPF